MNVSKILADSHHIQDALNDMNNKPITIGGKAYDHLREVQNNLTGLVNTISGLKSLIVNENTPDAVRVQALELLAKATRLYQRVVTQGINPKG